MPGPKPRPYAQWPAADRSLWQQAFCCDDPFSDQAGVRLAKASKERCMWAWRRFLGFLAEHEPIALEVTPAERLTIERVRPFVSHLAVTNAPTSVASIIEALYQAARFMVPETDWNWLKTVKARLSAAAPIVSSSGPVITSPQLLEIGERLMAESKSPFGTTLSRQAAVDYRNGLLFAFVAFVPIRPRNLVALEFDRHLIRNGDGWFVVVPGDETKTGTPLSFEIPELLACYMAYYVDVVRPTLLRSATCTAVWVSRNEGAALSYVGLVKIFQSVSRRFNLPVAPHDARDAAATTWAISVPNQIGVARDLLAHSDLRTTIKHYNRARGIEASRAYRQVITRMRSKQNRRAPADS